MNKAVKDKLVKVTNIKLEALEAVSEAIKAKEQDIVAITQSGKEELAELSTEWHEQQNELDNAPDLQTAREIQARKDRIEQDIRLQKTITENAIKKAVTDIEELAGEFRDVYYSVKQAYSALDVEVSATINVRTLDEYETLMSSYSQKASNLMEDLNRSLIAQRIIKQGKATYKGLHLAQAPLNAYARYVKVVEALKSILRTIK